MKWVFYKFKDIVWKDQIFIEKERKREEKEIHREFTSKDYYSVLAQKALEKSDCLIVWLTQNISRMAALFEYFLVCWFI